MKKLLFTLLSLCVASTFIACNDDDDFNETFLGKQIDGVSVTYTVPIYQPSLEWTEYIVSYTVADGSTVNDTISYDNVISGKVSLVSLAGNDLGREDGRAFLIKNALFTEIPDSCGMNVRMRLRSDVNMPGRIDLIMPKPEITAVVQYTDGNVRSVIGDGLDCNVISVEPNTELFKNIIEKEYFSTCTFYPSVQIYGGSK